MELPVDVVLHTALQQAGLEPKGTHGAFADPVATLLRLFGAPGGSSPAKALPERKAQKLARDFYHAAALSGQPFVTGGVATFMHYDARAHSVHLSGNFNGWSETADPMPKLGKTGLFLARRPAQHPVQYKLIVDKRWKADPANPYRTPDGHGDFNSVIPVHSPSASGSRLVSHPDLYSKALRNRRPVFVYLPAGYHTSTQRYPVVYIMDGHENLQRGRLPEVFDQAIAQGALPPLIAVFIPHAGRKRGLEYTPYFKRSRLDAYHRFVALELVPFIDKMFRTVRSPEARTLVGQSFGGTVVTTLGIRAPHIFQHILAQSGVYLWGLQNVLGWFAMENPPKLRFYLDCVDNKMETFQSRSLARVLSVVHFPHLFRSIPSRHEYEDWRERIVDGLRYLWFDIAPPPPQSPASSRKTRRRRTA